MDASGLGQGSYGFVRVTENLEILEIYEFQFPGLGSI